MPRDPAGLDYKLKRTRDMTLETQVIIHECASHSEGVFTSPPCRPQACNLEAFQEDACRRGVAVHPPITSISYSPQCSGFETKLELAVNIIIVPPGERTFFFSDRLYL